MTIVLEGKPVETKYELLSDGREIVASQQGRRIVSSLRWDGDALVGTWRVEIPNSEITISFRYELEDGAAFEPRNSFAAVAATRTTCGCSSGPEPVSCPPGMPAR
jgi:hypothetical protein